LLDADAIAIVVVAVLTDRDVEIELRITLVGLGFAQVPGGTGAAQHHAREAPAHAILEFNDADVDVALLENPVLGEQVLDIVQYLGVRLAKGGDVFDQAGRQVLVHAAEAEVFGVHTAARGALIEDHQLLALFEAP